jgi:carboxyl-terminal processing protease
MLDGVIGYIRIDQFDRVTLTQFTSALDELKGQQMRGVIIDVRNNPGGLLNTVTDIADILLPEGVITYTEDKSGERKYYNSDESALNLPIVLLVNGNSASASEVLCGAVKDMGRGVLVGEKTFGKGIVQNLYELSDGSAIKVTVAKYYTPNGICIQGEGIIPDYPVEMEGDSRWLGELEVSEDTQLQKAIDVMWSQLAARS